MLKDNFFSMSRFMNICRKDMVENWKTNLLRVTMMYVIMTVIFVWKGYFEYQRVHTVDPMVETSLYVFLWLGAVFGCISASFNMEGMKSKTSRLSILMIPVTPFEKFFSRWLISTIVYLIVFLITFKLADYTRVLVYSLVYPDHTIVASELKYLFTTSGSYSLFAGTTGDMKRAAFMCYLFFQSCFILGSSIWPRYALIKTIVAGFVIILVTSLILGGVGRLIIPDSGYVPRNVFSDDFEQNMRSLLFVISLFPPLINWTLAYFRFKESEIINRL